jgi:exopolysaccharide biosynthesis protein
MRNFTFIRQHDNLYFTNIMTCKSTYKLILLLIFFAFGSNLSAQIAKFNHIKWEREKIAPGLIWKSSHTILNDTIPQNINILIFNLHKRKLSLLYDPKKNTIVSKQAGGVGALAAVNGGFFSIKDGGSFAYIKNRGMIVDTDTAKTWTRNSNLNGSVMIDKSGQVLIDQVKMNNWYDSHQEYMDVLVTGPLLMKGKSKMQLPSTPLVINKHPRTAIGKKGNHKILVVTLDGRTNEARGMTLAELTEFMLSLHCKDAVNLDGGGSTTMWISGKPFNGVVNMPCDNKKFDHEGEREVSDVLIIK